MTDYSPESFNHRYVSLPTGLKMHVVDEGNPSNTCILLIHGFPDCWYGYRKQIKPLVQAGYRVLCPDCLGYGETTPYVESSDRYSSKKLAEDMIALLDVMKVHKAIVIGHDWGGFLAWRVGLFFPERVLAICGICTPYNPPHKTYLSVQEVAKIIPVFGYQVWINEKKELAESEMTQKVEGFLNMMLRYPNEARKDPRAAAEFIMGKGLDNLPANFPKGQLLTDVEHKYYISQFKKSGFKGNLNWYRTHKVNFECEKDLNPIIRHPALMVTAGRDSVLKPESTKKMEEFIPNLKRGHIEDAGHWILQEFPAEMNQIILNWLGSLNLKVTNSKL
eukprot:c13677_g1_i1.p1 GENE.c13677_g1_i1~~c13677_g1_i1.p1  ORF type:complete len:345 (-),score=116.88 c13677_g1_i1:40-1038(-)